MRKLFGTLVLAAMAVGWSAFSAQADSTVSCPLFQATRTIAEDLPPGWSTNTTISPVTNYKVDTSSGQQILVCEYGASGAVQRAAPTNENCAKIPNRKFKCISAPPPGPAVAIVSDGPFTIVDNGTADIDAGGPPDMRLRADNPFLRLLEPISGAKFSPQGTHMPTVTECISAPYSGSPIPQAQLPVGVWLCVATSDGNFARVRIANINGIPGFPLPMTIFMDHTTWSAGGGGAQPVHAQATVAIQQTFRIDLDEGVIGSGPDSDLWFQAVTPVQLVLKPVNGAQMAVGDKSNRGYDACSLEAFSPNPVALNTLAVGNYICFATNEGSVSQFRINGLTAVSPRKLTIAFTTWE